MLHHIYHDYIILPTTNTEYNKNACTYVFLAWYGNLANTRSLDTMLAVVTNLPGKYLNEISHKIICVTFTSAFCLLCKSINTKINILTIRMCNIVSIPVRLLRISTYVRKIDRWITYWKWSRDISPLLCFNLHVQSTNVNKLSHEVVDI
jgi:hypothetical protein